jgi:hypothetical protein
MACGSARTHMSSSSITTSDPHRSPKSLDHAWIRGFRASRGGSIVPGLRRDSAGDPLQMPPDADQGVSSTTTWAVTQSSRAELADSIEDRIIVRERHLIRPSGTRDHPGTHRSRSPCRAGVTVARRPGCRYGVQPVRSRRPGGFGLAGAISQAGMTAARATASKYSATVPGRTSK